MVALIIYWEAASGCVHWCLCSAAFEKDRKVIFPAGHSVSAVAESWIIGLVFPCWATHQTPELHHRRSIYFLGFFIEGGTYWFAVSNHSKNQLWRNWQSVTWDERLFVSFLGSIFLCSCPPALSLCSLAVKEGRERRRIMTSEVFSRAVKHGENTTQESSFCRWLPHWWFLSHTDLLEWIFSYSYTTQWFLSLQIK